MQTGAALMSNLAICRAVVGRLQELEEVAEARRRGAVAAEADEQRRRRRRKPTERLQELEEVAEARRRGAVAAEADEQRRRRRSGYKIDQCPLNMVDTRCMITAKV